MSKTDSQETLSWVNWAKVICLFIVYLYHAESRSGYFIGRLDELVEPFFVNIFFVVSGYLIFKKQMTPNVYGMSRKEWIRHDGRVFLKNLLFKIIIPTILFGALLYIPKVVIRGGELNMAHFLRHSIGGGGLWFTPALAVAEMLLFVLLIVRMVSPIRVFIVSIGLTIAAWFIHSVSPVNYPWYYQTGMCATLFLSFGGILYEIEHLQFKINLLNHKELVWVLAIGVYLVTTLRFTPPSHSMLLI